MFTTRNGTRYGERNVRRVLDKATEKVGAECVSFHTFRHTCASLLFANGKNIKQVSEWLGHADPSFTLRTYVHLMDAGLGGADFLDGATWGNPGATEGPKLAAKPTPLPVCDYPLESETSDQPQTPARAAESS